MGNDEIINIVINEINHIKNIEIKNEQISESLTGKDIGLDAIDMVYLLLALSNKFNISFTKEDLEDYKFNSVRNITEIIESKI